jgi:hypothetical protein
VTIRAHDGQTEAGRLAVLLGYRILDMRRERAFAHLVELAAAVCDSPVAAPSWTGTECG